MSIHNLEKKSLPAEYEPEWSPQRVIGEVTGERPGPTLICTAGLHGNEPAGIKALSRVLATLKSEDVSGQLVALSGNLTALRQGMRFIDEDLNRGWQAERVQALKSDPGCFGLAEDKELLGLLGEIEQAIARRRGPIYFIDLHTTSGESPPFAIIADTLRNRAFAFKFPVPIVLGLEEHLDGTLLEYVGNLGHITMVLEGGRHENPDSVLMIEAALWIALETCGIIEREKEPAAIQARRSLARAADSLPEVLEVRYRHAMNPGNGFAMRPGYRSFQQVGENEVLADDHSGEIRAKESGRILMPLYQSLGDDGFFLVREFRPTWLAVSAFLRKLRLDAVLPWLPGIKADPQRKGTIIVNRKVARWLVMQVFHLLGYRRIQVEEKVLILTRRSYDLPEPLDN